MAKRLLPIQLTQGMDQSADPSALPQGSLVEAVNVRPTRIASLRKRPNTRALAPPAHPNATGPFELIGNSAGVDLAAQDGYLFARDPGDVWDSAGRLSIATPLGQWDVQHPGELDIRSTSAIVHEGALLVTYRWTDSATVGFRNRLRAIDRKSRRVLLEADEEMAAIATYRLGPIVVDVGGKLLWFYRGSDAHIYAREIDPATWTLGSAVKVIGAAADAFSVCPGPGGQYLIAWVIFRIGLGMEHNIELLSASDHSQVALTQFTVAGSNVNPHIDVAADEASVYVAYSNDTYARARVYPHSLSAAGVSEITLGASPDEHNILNPSIAVLPELPKAAIVTYGMTADADGDEPRLRVSFVLDDGTAVHRIRGDDVPGVMPASRAVSVGSPFFWLFWGIAGSASAPLRKFELYEANFSGGRRVLPHAVAPGQVDSQGIGDTSGSAPVIFTEDGVTKMIWASRFVLRSERGQARPQCAVRELEMRIGGPRQLIEAGGAGYIPGGVLTQWDGAELTEAGLSWMPHVTKSSQDTGGSLDQGGSYHHAVSLERFDALGRRHSSAPSVPHSTQLSSSNSRITITFTPFGGSSRATWQAHVYRTEANGSVFHRATLIGQGITEGVSSYQDSTGDGFLQQGEILYTEGGVLNADAAPASTFGALALNRLWLGGLFDRRQIRCSTRVEPGVALSFPEDASHWLDFPEPVTGLAALEGNLVVLCERSVYLVAGEGPNLQGVGEFPIVQRIPCDLGCVDWRSVVSTSAGVFFQAEAGIMLLPRDGSAPQYIGQAIREVMESYSEVVAALTHHCASAGCAVARFVLRNPSDGKTRVATIALRPPGAWSIDDYPMDLETAGLLSGGPTFGGDGALLVEDSAGADAGTMRIATGEIAPAGVGVEWQMGRVWLNLRYRSTDTVTIRALFDDELESGPHESVSFSLADLTAGQQVRREWRPQRRRCSSVRFVVTAGDTEINSLTIEWEPIGGQQLATGKRA